MYHPQPSPDHLPEALLARFGVVGLQDLGEANLLERVDTKYLLDMGQLAAALEQLSGDYHLLRVEGRALNPYQTLYFDTPEFELYQQHHNGWADRYKLRARRYLTSSQVFLEVKHRNNRRRTVKQRMPIPYIMTYFDPAATAFIDGHTPFDSADFEPKLWNEYDRLTLVSKTRPERVTVDLNIAFGWRKREVRLGGLAVVEVKQDDHTLPSDFIDQMRRVGGHEGGFSKYCMGVYTLYPDAVKGNNLKPKLREVEKLIGEVAHVTLH